MKDVSEIINKCRKRRVEERRRRIKKKRRRRYFLRDGIMRIIIIFMNISGFYEFL